MAKPPEKKINSKKLPQAYYFGGLRELKKKAPEKIFVFGQDVTPNYELQRLIAAVPT